MIGRISTATFLIASFVGLSLAQAAAPTPKPRLSFRTVKPLSLHLDSQQQVAAVEKTLKQLGCATKTHSHDGHIDLAYECRYWRSLTLKDQSEVEKWDKWLNSKGFAVVRNTPTKDHKETVKYQLADWQTRHFNDADMAKRHVEMFKMLGCEVKQSKHDGHEDVRYRCAAWREIGLPDHKEAHGWIQVLKTLGFATLHEH